MIAYVHHEDQYGREIEVSVFTASTSTEWSGDWGWASTVVSYRPPETDEEIKAQLLREHKAECQQAFCSPPRRLQGRTTYVPAFPNHRRNSTR